MNGRLSRRDFTRGALAGLAAALPPLAGACAGRSEPVAAGPGVAAAATSVPAANPPAVPTPAPRPALAAADRQVKNVVLGVTSEAPIYIALEKGYFREEGLEVEVVVGLPPTQSVPALGTGDIDTSQGAIGPSIFRAIERGINLKLVAPMSYMTERNSSVWLCRRSGLQDRLRSLGDLRGARMAVVALGSINDYALAAAFQREGLDWQDGVDYVVLDFPSMPAALANGSVDAALISEPALSAAIELGVGERWMSYAGLVGRSVLATGVIAGAAFLAKGDGETAKRWMKAYLRGTQDYDRALIQGADAAWRAEVIDILARTTTIKDRAMYDRMTYSILRPDGTLDEESVRDQLAYWQGTGFPVPPYDDVVDTRAVRAAHAELARG